MSFEFRPARRENVPLLIGLAGYTGSGKTLSGMKIAAGIAGDQRFAVIDTENGRASHYADKFRFDSADLRPPFRPDAYADAIAAADGEGYPVVMVDSMSHEYAGDGGLLDWHEEELDRMAGDDWKKREAMTFSAWVKPKQTHKRMVSRLLQVRAHVILCFRAEEKIEIVKKGGKTVIQPKQTLAGGSLDGWVPITEKTLPYEMTVSLLLSPSEPGVPRPIKLPETLRAFVPLDAPLTEATGERLAKWARGSEGALAPPPASSKAPGPSPQPPVGSGSSASSNGDDGDVDGLTAELMEAARGRGIADETLKAIQANRRTHADDLEKHVVWLERQLARLRETEAA